MGKSMNYGISGLILCAAILAVLSQKGIIGADMPYLRADTEQANLKVASRDDDLMLVYALLNS